MPEVIFAQGGLKFNEINGVYCIKVGSRLRDATDLISFRQAVMAGDAQAAELFLYRTNQTERIYEYFFGLDRESTDYYGYVENMDRLRNIIHLKGVPLDVLDSLFSAYEQLELAKELFIHRKQPETLDSLVA